MAKTLVGALALASLPCALAFLDTSPFFLFSTAKLAIDGRGAAIARATSIVDQVEETLSNCPSKTYLFVQQNGVSAADYLDGLSAPRLGHFMGGKHGDVKSTMAVSEAVGTVDWNAISTYVQAKCGAEMLQVDLSAPTVSPRSEYPPEPLIIYATLSAPLAPRAAVLDTHDYFLEKLIGDLDTQDYTVIYTTTPQTAEQIEASGGQRTYEMDHPFGEAVHMELKRDTAAHTRRDEQDEGGLFERYQYLSPGLFMGITAVIPLLIILYVGLTAITSLEVSYFAFSKEMGPSAQRKQ